MTATELAVLLGDQVVAHIYRDNGKVSLHYQETYRSLPNATPVSLSMPLTQASYSHNIVDPWLWNFLPDNVNVLAQYGLKFGVSPRSAFGLLSTPIGQDCAGALRFVPPDQLNAADVQTPGMTPLSLAEVAARVADLIAHPADWLGTQPTGRFSLAGAQAKTALLYLNGSWAIPHGSLPTTHLLKPAIPHLIDHDLNEHLCLAALHELKILSAHSEIMTLGDHRVIVVQRYDRIIEGEHIIRVHQEDMCQALGVAPERKYQNEGGPTPSQIVGLFRRVMPADAAQATVERFAMALLVNWIIAGTDAHAKNYSVLLSGPNVQLAPLYDVASALPYPQLQQRKLRLAMKFGKSYGLDASASTWGALGDSLGLDSEWLRAQALQLTQQLPDAFATVANTPEVKGFGSSLPQVLIDAVAARAAKCQKTVIP